MLSLHGGSEQTKHMPLANAYSVSQHRIVVTQ